MDADDLMDFVVRTTQRAGEITLAHFGSAEIEFKGDGSEVTAADRASEEFIRDAVREEFPGDRVLGEEGGERAAGFAQSRRRWIIDPIDGTRSFSSGVPLYGVLLALEIDGVPVLGCCHFPVLSQTLVAAGGAGAWLNGARCRVSDCEDLASARVVTSGLEYWRDWATEEGKRGWETLVARTRFARTWGDCYGYFLVATGRAEVMADPACGAVWDFAPMAPIIREAGGRFTALTGEAVSKWSTALATNGRLHAAATGCWAGSGSDFRFQTEAVLQKRNEE